MFEHAKEAGLIGRKRSLDDSLYGVYPLRLEEIREYKGIRVLFRPSRPVDARMIQEHFYSLDHGDVLQRFMQDKRIFGRTEVSGMYEVDYVNDLTIVAVIGEIGFEQVIAIGGYYRDQAKNTAEVAYSVSKDWQRLGLSQVIQSKLLEAARENGIQGFEAYTTPRNQGMIRLFNKMPYKVRSVYEEDMIVLKTRFDEPA